MKDRRRGVQGAIGGEEVVGVAWFLEEDCDKVSEGGTEERRTHESSEYLE